MNVETLRFILCALLMLLGLIFEISAVVGVFRFLYVLNRMHAAAMGDTMGVFLMLLDRLMPHLHIGSDEPEGLPAHLKRTTMVVLAVTLHNIPEGMAVGLAFAVAARDGGAAALPGAVALAIGMGLFVCGQLTHRCRHDETALPLRECFVNMSRVLLLVLPLLLAAAVTEAYITPLVSSLFL